ncbi:MAG: SCP2 sterol-binding domain-containing protein [gamma proteobacterium symbiont of Bathyaustriella thionipta]|nr:SCP2 sterol-binding domain-containing protein [gamma proteobacterium symbiont of Bathyaustriella thionipta]
MSAMLSASVEAVLNRLLSLDPISLQRLQAYHGKRIELDFKGTGMRLFLVPGSDGIAVYQQLEEAADCTLSATPLVFARMGMGAEASDQLFSGQLEIRGDTALGHSFGRLLAGLHIDWEEQLAAISGDLIAHNIASGVRSGLQWLSDTHQRLDKDLKEYLQEEVQAMPSDYELQEWLQAVDTLRDDVERLQARVERLQARRSAQ